MEIAVVRMIRIIKINKDQYNRQGKLLRGKQNNNSNSNNSHMQDLLSRMIRKSINYPRIAINSQLE